MSNPQPSFFGLLLGWVAVAWLGFGVMTIINNDAKKHLGTVKTVKCVVCEL